ncbi:hypothetical protein ABZ348_30555 [Streptomyces sp. NPDC005963]|uniref:hypothetical protein n=1 Tax=Streptomyces sp. NPDC005963 TaxID=3156721 RepID=UPI0033D5A75D
MADTATAPPDTTAGGTTTEDIDTAEYTVVTEPSETTDPAPETKKTSRGRPQALPLIVHGTNATGIATGIAYAVAGVPGLIAAGAAGVAVAAAALAGRKKRSKVSAARKAAAANRSGGGSGRAGGGAGKGGLLGRGGGRGRSGGGAGGGRMNNRGGRLNGTGGKMNGAGKGAERRPGGGRHAAGGGTGGSGSGKNGRGPGGLLGRGGGRGKDGLGSGANTPKGTGGGKNGPSGSRGGGKAGAGQQSRTGKAWQTLTGWGNKMRRNNGGSGTGTSGSAGSSGGSGSGSGSSGKGATPAKSRLGRAMQKMRGWAGKLRPSKKSKGSTPGGTGGTGKSGPRSGRLYRMRRVAARKLGHWARCVGAGLLAGLAGLLTLPLGILWGTWRLLTRHRDPLHGFAFPVRLAGRIWRFFFRRSKARHDKEAKADQLNLTVNDPRKDTDPVTGPSLAAGSSVLDGNNSKFALAMRATYSAYTGYSPTSMMEVAAEYAGLPNGIRAAALAVQQMAVNSDQKYPCSKRAIAKLAEAAQRLVNAASRAENMVALFRYAHAFDIERIVAPRTNEWMWNVTPTGSSADGAAMFQPGRIESGCVLMAVLYRSFDPVHMMQVGSEYQGMSYGLNALADAIEALHQRTRDLYPVDDRVTDELGTLVQMIRAAADDADMAAKLFLEDHRLEISHNTNPRKGPAAESMWNTPR